MKADYDTCKKGEIWPRFTLLKRDLLKQFELYLCYFITAGVLYLVSTWLKSIQMWPYYEAEDGTYILVEEPDGSFEIIPISERYITESSIKFSISPTEKKQIQVM